MESPHPNHNYKTWTYIKVHSSCEQKNEIRKLKLMGWEWQWLSGVLGRVTQRKAGQWSARSAEAVQGLPSPSLYCLLAQKVAFEAYVPFSNVWKFALAVAQFPDPEFSFFLCYWASYKKGKKAASGQISPRNTARPCHLSSFTFWIFPALISISFYSLFSCSTKLCLFSLLLPPAPPILWEGLHGAF